MRSKLKVLALALALAPIAGGAAAQFSSAGADFLKAVRDRDGTKVMELLQANGSTVVNYRDYGDGESALHIATARRDPSYMNLVLGWNANPNIRNEKGDTALITAARIGFTDGIDLLLRSGAKVDLDNRAGETPLIIAVQQRQAAAVKRLLEAGGNPDKTDSAAGRSARDYAKLDRRNTELLRLIETVKGTRSATVAGPKR
jgi:ankyrin repeat protein